MATVHWNARLLAESEEGSRTLSPSSMGPEHGVAAVARAPESMPDLDRLLESWFRDHYSRLWRFVARLGVPSGLIDDVVQDAFITASRRHFDIHRGREWGFLVGAAVRLGANYRLRASARREVPRSEILDDAASALPNAEQLLIEKRARQKLELALSALTDAHRAVFVLYELEGFSAPEIAAILELPLGTVVSRLGRARAKFSKTAARMQRSTVARSEDL